LLFTSLARVQELLNLLFLIVYCYHIMVNKDDEYCSGVYNGTVPKTACYRLCRLVGYQL